MRTLHRTSVGLVILAAALLILSPASLAYADDCVAIGGTPFVGPPAECRISGAHTVAPAAYSLDTTLHFLAGGIINVSPPTAPPTPFSIAITGNLLMDAGSQLHADAAGGTPGGVISITATGNITLLGGAPGALITANTPLGSCPPSKPKAGVITLAAGDNVVTQDGSRVETRGGCGKGEITITGKLIDIDGVVISEGTTSKGAGGPISVIALCTLNISPTGQVLSIGRDPGADLVLLSGGCQVTVFGLVASTGAGHSTILPFPTLCDDGLHVLGTFLPRACVRILAGENTAGGGPSIIIDSRPPNNGEVHADTGFSGGVKGFGWIEVFAKGDIEIDGDTTPPFAIHANQGLTSGHGGLISIKSTANGIAALGLAVQASDTTSGGRGGTIFVQAKKDVNLNNNSGEIEAAGALVGGGNQQGGNVFIQSFGTAPNTGSILAVATFAVDVTGRTPPSGTVDLKACGLIQFPPATVIPASIVPTMATGVCGGAPVLTAGVLLPNCGQCGTCACLNSFGPVQAAGGAVLTLNGDNLTAVETVIFGANCDPGSAAANGTVDKTLFTSQTGTGITLTVPAGLAAGPYKIIVVFPGQLPNSTGSCCAPGSFTKQ